MASPAIKQIALKITHLAYSDAPGGASNAVYRLHRALRAAGTDSTVVVNEATRGDWTVCGPVGMEATASAWWRPRLATLLKKGLRAENAGSLAIIPSRWHEILNRSDSDIIHLHWINAEMMSVKDIGRIEKPLVWTLHDMWAFNGTGHCPDGERWREGYRRDNRPSGTKGFDLDRWAWKRKLKHWRHPMHIVTPSRWLAACAGESRLMGEWPVTVVPNALDTDLWSPIDKRQARELLRLPQDKQLLLFGAMGGGHNRLKGFDLLLDALDHLRGEIDGLQLVIFGQLAPKTPPNPGFPVHYTGRLHDELSLRIVYSAADVLVNPSRREAFGQTASEAHACGTPAVVFNNSGLVDIVQHQKTGYLAQAFDTLDLARGIQWVLKEQASSNRLSENARNHAVKHFSYPVVAAQYLDVYRQALTGQGDSGPCNIIVSSVQEP